MKLINNRKYNNTIISILSIIIGITMIIFPKISSVLLCYIIGIILIISGITDLIIYFKYKYSHSEFVIGFLKSLMGLLLIIHPYSAINIFTLSISILILINSFIHIQASLNMKKIGIKNWWYSLIISIIGFILGVIILVADNGSNSIMVLIGMGLIVTGIDLLFNNRTKENEKNIEIEADDIN